MRTVPCSSVLHVDTLVFHNLRNLLKSYASWFRCWSSRSWSRCRLVDGALGAAGAAGAGVALVELSECFFAQESQLSQPRLWNLGNFFHHFWRFRWLGFGSSGFGGGGGLISWIIPQVFLLVFEYCLLNLTSGNKKMQKNYCSNTNKAFVFSMSVKFMPIVTPETVDFWNDCLAKNEYLFCKLTFIFAEQPFRTYMYLVQSK